MTTIKNGIARIGYEVRSYFRTPDQVFFTFLFPALMLAIFATAFGSMDQFMGSPDGYINAATYYLPAMLGGGILLSGVQNLAIDIATEKGDGTLKRLGGTPLSPVSYFIGKLGQVFVTAVLQSAIVIMLGVFAFGADMPTEPEKWFTFAWVFLLGVTTSALLGIALSAVPRTGKSASAVVIPIVLILQFISGVYLVFSMLPEWLQNIAGLFPLKWMAQGMRAVFLPDGLAVLEQGGVWNVEGVALWLGVWLVAGLVLSLVTFRWIRRDA